MTFRERSPGRIALWPIFQDKQPLESASAFWYFKTMAG